MIFEDTYKEIKSATRGIYKQKGSKFIAYSYPIYSEEDAKYKLAELKKKEYSARHHCYAYVLKDKSTQRVNDDGEPSSTAGKPILRQILSHNLTNILIVVVRYSGGVKLGTAGLIRSYKTAATEAISKAEFIIKTINRQYEVSFKYPQINNVMKLVKEFDLHIVHTNFNIDCKLIFSVPKSKSEKVSDTFKKNHKISIEYLEEI